MLKDGRNFRSSYYEKVGFRNIDDSKYLDVILASKDLDLNRLSQFCLRFTVPGVHRALVWKLVLKVLPFNKECHSFVTYARQDQYNDLRNALIEMKYIDKAMPESQIVIAMWLLENKCLKFTWKLEIELHRHFLHICQVLCSVFFNEVDIYWVSKGFFNCVKTFENSVSWLVEFSKNLLFKTDSALHCHLLNIESLHKVPYHSWFRSCFAGTLHELALLKVWDKVICGAHKILCVVSVALLRTFRHSLMSCNNIADVSHCFLQISKEASEKIVNNALELWYQQGSSILPFGPIPKV
ncbi:TBC1 domain family member 7 isoform X1 [Bemisia tabaci]|uniref:TBC1 domain family member 7 isoform X1 n=1 Tax=Bemisia tabaci TaxID=7038 RepID=UPI0008F9E2B8|nr:PREDICTED: TBC1 domain family member 7 isoform X1 [Bemisia tabaci]XP_018905103.1 PREDICTED: TBC1 domain family member 7 isoform X1 [Bemisia tabaci]XP_018905104.1 PREDICTED: TBC1 domain family member 7 isoform X1 [Bemisia tabaci]